MNLGKHFLFIIDFDFDGLRFIPVLRLPRPQGERRTGFRSENLTKPKSLSIFLLFCILLFVKCNNVKENQDPGYLIPFTKNKQVNPVLEPHGKSLFYCPVRKEMVGWEEKDIFNPATVVKDDTLFLLYRAEDTAGKYNGTSRIGLAYSLDGYHFNRQDNPVLFPSEDEYQKYEWEGGCEDPRIVEDVNGTYYMTYSAYDGDKARLLIATSEDLRHWTKYGSVFQKAGSKYVDMWSKSGSIVCNEDKGKLVAARINDEYWMYWGDTDIFIATSDNLIDWTPLLVKDTKKTKSDKLKNIAKTFQVLISPRNGMFDSDLVEPGPPAIITNKGILFIYNSRNSAEKGDKNLAPGTYSAGQIIADKNDPTKVLHRMDIWFITPDHPFEITGQVNNVCFVEGLAHFKNKWFLYYGTADSKIAVAESDGEK
jgi:predicted GH43/DUF377 family glycosyl hydrolase